MYKLMKIEDTVRIPPKLFSENLEKSVIEALRQQYEGFISKKTGVIVAVTKADEIAPGKIILGDGATYHKVKFEALVFKPELHEIVRGKVNDITEFGAFIRFGPIDGLVHVSQVTDDFMSYNPKTGALSGKQSKKSLKKDDIVLARITAISLKDKITDSKINLTMRQEGLGKKEWLKKKKTTEKNKKKGGKK